MRPFPPSEQLQFLLDGDSSISQITINPHSVAFAFQNGCRIEVENVIEYQDGLGARTVYDREWFDAPVIAFHRLLETPLRAVDSQGLQLTLTFEGQRILVIHSTLEPYEAGEIQGPPGSGLGLHF